MEQKTKINAETGRQEMFITREFNLPVNLLFRAHTEAALIEQWMGNKVLKLESKKHGSYEFEIRDPQGNIVFSANGVIHELTPDKRITRTFEMGNSPFGVQLEIYDFEPLTDDTSRLTMHVIYESAEKRDGVLKLPFAQGLNWAHNRLEEAALPLK